MFHLSQMDQIFLKSLADVVRTSRTTSQYDKLTFTTQTIADIKNEIQSRQESVRYQALLKLFFLAMEGNNIRWAEFQIINLMGCADFQLKLGAQLAAHLVIDSQSQGLIMVTNVFQKEFKNGHVECSATLSCLGTIANKDLSDSLLTHVLKLTTNTKPLIRKKAIAVLSKIFTINPLNIPGNLEMVIQQLQKESNISVLACGISLFCSVMKVAPKLYPLFLSIVYDQISKQKSNWLLIKLVRISNKLISLEPRFQGKLIEHYTRLLNQTNSKSLQYELVYSIMKYFKNHSQLYESAGDILKQFLNHQDPNLRCLGLECLTHISSSAGLMEFQEQILESFKKSDYFSKLQILQLFKDFTNQQNFQTVIEFFLKYSDLESNHKIIESLIFIIMKDKFINVDDPEKLLLVYIPVIAQKIDTIDNAIRFKELLFELLTRVPGLKVYSDQLCNQILQTYAIQSDTLQGPTLNIVQRHTQLKYSLNHREIIFKSLIMIVGESVKLLKLDALTNIIKFLEQLNILNCYESSLSDIDSLLFKIYIQIIKTDPSNDIIPQIEQLIKNIYNKLHNISIVKISFFYESFILNKTKEQLQQLYNLYAEDLPPINLEAQKLIKPPEGLDITQSFQIDIEEIEKIKNSNNDQLEQKPIIQQLEQADLVSKEQEDQNTQILKQEENEEELKPLNTKTDPIPKKVFTINRDEELPPGVNQNDINQSKEEE
ncbi:unnamed protein product (macronuclear) [Paramecium tetraurelia]|uniref:Clathrin/coatomer adaptor adaptin-like N-terminal domain-containing protein n=1 Tax=Paramecium tetraurelia TaxID=5888 RepID=A0BAS5_PARTE|nr:uncharacterized protein GSPATT00000077001 [Paramecium tetraurelia]CAK55642.1 unnamed protein product [Paramecium tetraurelia]|eukprot:XP_001423040.1 hypothetical protein (macronuclear) [Paramecium tetraurelia strain d4-2]